jgi:hypothetical protein
MTEQAMPAAEQPRETFPQNWRIASDYDPNDHLMNLKGRDYLNVQNRLLWFIRDQRGFIISGLARMPYIIRTELVEMDREAGFAHFKTYVRDVLGNEATMYGSESAKDFADFAEKASTKSLGRALLSLGYGTAFAPEMDEADRVVDAPVERRRQAPSRTPIPTRAPQPAAEVPKPLPSTASGAQEQPATEQQMISIRKLCAALGKPEPEAGLSYPQARTLITQLSGEYQRARRAS